jgi:hypothetical protein
VPMFELRVQSGIVVCVLCVLFGLDLTLDFCVFACSALHIYKQACIEGTARGTLVPVFVPLVHSGIVVCVLCVLF